MAMPFPSTDAPTEARFDNVPKFDDLDRLSIGDIADMPPDLLLALQEAAATETARVKRLKDRFEAALAQRYGAATEAERSAQGKTSGTVRIEDTGVVVIADLPKKVTWDQDRLASMAARITASGDDPTEYLEIAYRVPERRFTAWPEAMRDGFASARSETTGKPAFRLEARDR
ncbi:hypothetical protein JHW45_11340 [Paracoccus stylophorae]|uniref:Uncharacterized protein n=1 Tax=Paracoccus stylophorae TaxID=659350 RepID=A0ABY7SRP7_9RHOB|nr:hypothetical protein [Paracoccus stylophorae]WCR09691.1 hypothetical protein JHW45_11340 [Paracoccus stylophorae]